ncbi:Regulator of chromosome condensation [Dermatophagoides farinae]|uniref:Regulator of chromosome condensation n=1 Tax=Dermatophagoides farinae TaxID=6954 RepID=A0A922I6T3_DERFA|nr:Regulator of chromosome condensation [Dermatophagoides farinae]
MVNRSGKRKASSAIDTNPPAIDDNSEAIIQSTGHVMAGKKSTPIVVDNGDDERRHQTKSAKRSTRRTNQTTSTMMMNTTNNNNNDPVESQIDNKSNKRTTRGNRKQTESTTTTTSSNSVDIVSTSTIVDEKKSMKKSAKNVKFEIDNASTAAAASAVDINVEEDKTKPTLRRSSRTTTRASTAASSSSSSSAAVSKRKITTKSSTAIKKPTSSSRSRSKKQDNVESTHPSIEHSHEEQNDTDVEIAEETTSVMQSKSKSISQQQTEKATKNKPKPTASSQKRSTRAVRSKSEAVEKVVDNESKIAVEERPRSTRKTAAATLTESVAKSTTTRNTRKQRNKTEIVDEVRTEHENAPSEPVSASSKSCNRNTGTNNFVPQHRNPKPVVTDKSAGTAKGKSTRSRRAADTVVVDDDVIKTEPEVSVVANEDEPDNKQQPLEPKQEVEIEKDGHDQSESEQQKPTNDLKITEVVDKANEIVEVIESETSISQSSSSTTAEATKEDGRSVTDDNDNDIKTCTESVESEMKKKSHDIPKKQVSFEIVDMDDNEEITSDTPVVNIDDEKMIVDYDSHSMPSSVESKDKQQDSDLDSTIIVIEEVQSDDSLQHQSTISESITKQETEIKPPSSSSSVVKETEPEMEIKESKSSTVITNDVQTKIDVDIKPSISVVDDDAPAVKKVADVINSNGQSSITIEHDDDRGLKRKVDNTFNISEEKIPMKKAKFELQNFGNLFTMGDQISKELGPREIHFRGRKTLRSQPAKVRTGSFKIKQVAMGALHTLALTVDGQVLSFGCNDDYVLGRIITREEYLNDKITTNGGDNDDMDELDVDDDEFEEKLSGRPLPVKELQSKKVVKVSAGDMHSAALCDDGKVYVWGNFKNDSDKVGLFVDCEKSPNCSDYLPVILPKPIELDVKIVDIASGCHHILLLTDEGRVLTFGEGSKGQLGRIGSTELNSINTNRDQFLRPAMVSIPEQARIDHVFASQWNSFALSSDGNLYGWGLNNYFQLGLKNNFISQANSLNSDSLFTLIPTRIPLSFHCKQISNGQQHSLALDRDGNVYACGSALYGKLGLGEDFIQQCNSNDKSISDFKQIPSSIFNGERVIKIDCGDFCSMAITEMGRLYCWGQGGLQIGTDADVDLFEPKQITKGPYAECTRFISISTGAQMAAMIGTIIIDDNVNEDDDSLMESK